MGQSFQLTVAPSGIATLGYSLPCDPVDKFTARTMRELERYLTTLDGTTSIHTLLVRRTAIVADQTRHMKQDASLQDRPWSLKDFAARGQKVLNKLSSFPFPTVAVINGPCMGAELELALACTFRVATDDAYTKLGFPEVQFGVIPGLGGTQRLPRLIGFQHALRMIVDGEQVGARKAREWGLVDLVCPVVHLPDALQAFIAQLESPRGREKIRKHRQRDWLHRFTEENWIMRRLVSKRYRNRLARRGDGDFAPLRALELIGHTAHEDMATGLEQEAKEFAQLSETRAAKNLARLYDNRKYLQQHDLVPCESAPPRPRGIAIVGENRMGRDFARLATRAKVPVFDGLDIENITDQKRSDLAGVDIVLEAMDEDPQVKQGVLRKLEQHVSSRCLLISLSSFLPVRDSSMAIDHPDRCLGISLSADSHPGALAEIIRGPQTDAAALALAVRFVQQLQCMPVIVNDSAGYIVGRIQFAMLNETLRLIAEGAGPVQIDRAMRGFGMRWGPCQILDRMGLGDAWYGGKVMESSYGDRFRWDELLDYLCNEYGLGCDGNPGIYVSQNGRLTVNPKFRELLRDYRDYTRRSELPFVANEVRERLLLVVVNEAFRCLDEGLISNHEYLDLAIVHGMGFPGARGGPLAYAEATGFEVVCRRLKILEEQHTKRFHPCRLLTRMVDSAALSIRKEEESVVRAESQTPINHPVPLPTIPRLKKKLPLAI